MQRREVFRDIRRVFRGENALLARKFRCDCDDDHVNSEGEEKQDGNLWGRSYVFWRNGEPLTLVYEVFSPTLSEFLGENPASRLE